MSFNGKKHRVHGCAIKSTQNYNVSRDLRILRMNGTEKERGNIYPKATQAPYFVAFGDADMGDCLEI